MRTEDKYGWVTLFVGQIALYMLQYEQLGLFFYGMALGFFIKSLYKRFKDKK